MFFVSGRKWNSAKISFFFFTITRRTNSQKAVSDLRIKKVTIEFYAKNLY